MAYFCGKCGAHLDPATGLCPNCDSNQISQGSKQFETRRSFGRHSKCILTVAVLIAATLAVVCMLGYFGVVRLPSFLCSHEWQDATCTTAKMCRICGEVVGEPMGHTPGAWKESNDILQAKQYREKVCSTCGVVMETEERPLTSFVEDESFLFTAEQFQERMLACLKNNSANPDGLLITKKTGTRAGDPDSNDLLLYQVTYEGEDIAVFYCYDCTDSLIKVENKSDEPVWSVTFFVPYYQEDDYATVQNVFDAMMAACDPSLTAQDRRQYILRWGEWIANCYEEGWPSSMQAKNGILYLADIVTHDDGSRYFYGTAYATTDFGSINTSGASVYDGAQDPPAKAPNYSTEEAEQLLTGDWVSKCVIFDIDGELYGMDVEGSKEDCINLTFRQDHCAEMDVKAFSLDDQLSLGVGDFWNGRKIQWDYMYDTGETLYYLIETPYMRTSVPYCYDPQSSNCGLLRVWLSESISVLFEKQ